MGDTLPDGLQADFDLPGREIRFGNCAVPLTKTMARILQHLVDQPGTWIAGKDLLDTSESSSVTSVHNQFKKLRKAFEAEFGDGGATFSRLIASDAKNGYQLKRHQPPSTPLQATSPMGWLAAARVVLQEQRKTLRRPVTYARAETEFRIDGWLEKWHSELRKPQASHGEADDYPAAATVSKLAAQWSRAAKPYIALIGPAGAGKSTTLDALIDETLALQPESLLILVPLMDLKTRDLPGYLEEVWLGKLRAVAASGTEPRLADLLNGQVYLFLDGMEEMGGRAEALASLGTWLRAMPGQLKVAMTCRDQLWRTGFLALPDFTPYELRLPHDFTADFTTHWFEAADRQSILDDALQVLEDPRFTGLTRSPLSLALLCDHLTRSGGEAPSTRGALFEGLWSSTYQWKRAELGLHLRPDMLVTHLSRLAREMLDHSTGLQINRLRAFGLVGEEAMNAALTLGWLREVSVQDVAFDPPVLLEFFAAKTITSGDAFLPAIAPPPVAAPYRIFDPAWHEVFLFWLAGATPREATAILDGLMAFQDGCLGYHEQEAMTLAAAGFAEFPAYAGGRAIVERLLDHTRSVLTNTAAVTAAIARTHRPTVIECMLGRIRGADGQDAEVLQWSERLIALGHAPTEVLEALRRLARSTRCDRQRLRAIQLITYAEQAGQDELDHLEAMLAPERWLFEVVSAQHRKPLHLGKLAVAQVALKMVPGHPAALAAARALMHTPPSHLVLGDTVQTNDRVAPAKVVLEHVPDDEEAHALLLSLLHEDFEWEWAALALIDVKPGHPDVESFLTERLLPILALFERNGWDQELFNSQREATRFLHGAFSVLHALGSRRDLLERIEAGYRHLMPALPNIVPPRDTAEALARLRDQMTCDFPDTIWVQQALWEYIPRDERTARLVGGMLHECRANAREVGIDDVQFPSIAHDIYIAYFRAIPYPTFYKAWHQPLAAERTAASHLDGVRAPGLLRSALLSQLGDDTYAENVDLFILDGRLVTAPETPAPELFDLMVSADGRLSSLPVPATLVELKVNVWNPYYRAARAQGRYPMMLVLDEPEEGSTAFDAKFWRVLATFEGASVAIGVVGDPKSDHGARMCLGSEVNLETIAAWMRRGIGEQ